MIVSPQKTAGTGNRRYNNGKRAVKRGSGMSRRPVEWRFTLQVTACTSDAGSPLRVERKVIKLCGTQNRDRTGKWGEGGKKESLRPVSVLNLVFWVG